MPGLDSRLRETFSWVFPVATHALAVPRLRASRRWRAPSRVWVRPAATAVTPVMAPRCRLPFFALARPLRLPDWWSWGRGRPRRPGARRCGTWSYPRRFRPRRPGRRGGASRGGQKAATKPGLTSTYPSMRTTGARQDRVIVNTYGSRSFRQLPAGPPRRPRPRGVRRACRRRRSPRRPRPGPTPHGLPTGS